MRYTREVLEDSQVSICFIRKASFLCISPFIFFRLHLVTRVWVCPMPF